MSKRLGRREREKLRERANEAFKLSRSGFTPQGSVKVEARIPSVSYRRSTANSSVLVPSLKYETVTVIHEREGFGGTVQPQKFLQGSKTGNAIMVPMGRAMPNIRKLEPDKPETNPDTGEALPPIHRGSGVSGGTHLPRSLTRNTAQAWGEPNAYRGKIEKRRGKTRLVKPKDIPPRPKPPEHLIPLLLPSVTDKDGNITKGTELQRPSFTYNPQDLARARAEHELELAEYRAKLQEWEQLVAEKRKSPAKDNRAKIEREKQQLTQDRKELVCWLTERGKT